MVGWVMTAYQLPERRACRAVGVARSSARYRSVRPSQEPLRRRLHELASVRVRSGYRLLHSLLRREGWGVNEKRIYRLYTEEGLTLKRRRPRRHRSASARVARTEPRGSNDQWAMDFMHDTLSDGRSIRVLTAIDIYSRECVALVAGKKFSGAEVAKILDAASRERRAKPKRIRVDNGTEFTSKALDRWAYWNRVELDFSRPGKPADNAFIEAFNASLRRECLSQHWFLSLEEAQRILEAWRMDYNNVRPHSALANRAPSWHGQGGYFVPDRNRLQNLPA